MTIRVVEGNLLLDPSECLVNAVNVVGVMGAGLAKQFAKRWPEMFVDYRKACREGRCRIGTVHMWRSWSEDLVWIANVPTKAHWRDNSTYEYVESGLADLVDNLHRRGIGSVAVPALGCGLGGLDFARVLPLVEAAFEHSTVDVRVYRGR